MSKDMAYIIMVKQILEFINKQKQPQKIGPLYNEYIKEWGEFCFSYRTFQRAIDEISERELINVKKVIGGSYGSTTIISKK